jgi:hypothetical protein
LVIRTGAVGFNTKRLDELRERVSNDQKNFPRR